LTAVLRAAVIVTLALAAAGAGVYLGGQRSSAVIADPKAAAQLMSLTLQDSDGRAQSLSQWRDRVLVVNFWATWCPPCLEEIPAFSRLSTKHAGKGVQFVGIGIDSQDNVRRFASELPVPYPLLVGNMDTMRTATALGNTVQGLPFTVVLDRRGAPREVKTGILPEAKLDQILARLSAEE
jgi:thiol-disulfide isomerase/thioredoxin